MISLICGQFNRNLLCVARHSVNALKPLSESVENTIESDQTQHLDNSIVHLYVLISFIEYIIPLGTCNYLLINNLYKFIKSLILKFDHVLYVLQKINKSVFMIVEQKSHGCIANNIDPDLNRCRLI